MVFVDKLAKPQQDELKKAFEKISTEGANPIPVPAEQAGNPYQQPGNVEEEKFDAFDFAEEKDCLKKYDDAWCEKILGAPKWSDKKDMLTELIADIDTPKIKPGDSNALVTALKKLLTDSNITVFH